jgi:hypothetical protein
MVMIFAVLSTIGLVGMLVSMGPARFTPSKLDLLEQLGRFHVLFSTCSPLGPVAAYLARSKLWLFYFVVLMGFHVFIGFRTSAAIGFICILAIWCFGEGKQRIVTLGVKNWAVLTHT